MRRLASSAGAGISELFIAGDPLPEGRHVTEGVVVLNRCANLVPVNNGRRYMAVSFPPGVGKAAFNVPHLIDLQLTPPSPPSGPLPIPYPNTAHFEPGGPAFLVVHALFGDIEVVGTAAPTDLWLV